MVTRISQLSAPWRNTFVRIIPRDGLWPSCVTPRLPQLQSPSQSAKPNQASHPGGQQALCTRALWLLVCPIRRTRNISPLRGGSVTPSDILGRGQTLRYQPPQLVVWERPQTLPDEPHSDSVSPHMSSSTVCPLRSYLIGLRVKHFIPYVVMLQYIVWFVVTEEIMLTCTDYTDMYSTVYTDMYCSFDNSTGLFFISHYYWINSVSHQNPISIIDISPNYYRG